MCACARVRAGEGGAGGAARPARRLQGRRLGPPVAARAPQRAAQLGVPATRAAAPAAHLEGGAGRRAWGPGPGPPLALPPATHKAEPAEKERRERDAPGGRAADPPPPGAPCAPRTQHQPRAPTYLAKGAAAAPGESEANFGAASPALSSVPGSLPGSRSPGWATPPLLSTAPAPGPAGCTQLPPAAPGKGGQGGGASLHGLSLDAAAPGPGPAARTGPRGGSESAKCLVGARGGRRGRGGGCRGSARLGRRGAARAMLRMFGMRTGMK